MTSPGAEPLVDSATLPDIEGAARAWLRAHPRLAPVGGRIFFGVPDAVSDPFVTVARIGGGSYDPRLSFSAYSGTKNSAADVAQRIAAAVEGIGSTEFAPGVIAHSGNVDMILWQPTRPDGKPRYVVDVTIFVAAT